MFIGLAPTKAPSVETLRQQFQFTAFTAGNNIFSPFLQISRACFHRFIISARCFSGPSSGAEGHVLVRVPRLHSLHVVVEEVPVIPRAE